MAGSMRTTIVLGIVILIFSACSNTKHIPADDKLYVGARVKVSGEHVNLKHRKTLRNDLQGITRPRPNTRFLGIPIKLSIYNLFHNSKGFFGKLRDKFGEPPVLLSDVDLAHNEKVLDNYLDNKGFF